MDGAEDIEVGGGADVALIGGEAEHRDGQLFLIAGLGAQVGPANGPFGNGIHPVLQGVGLASGVIAATEHDRFDRAIEFRDGDLQCHLHRVQAEVAGFPFLGGLEHQRQRHHVGAIEALEGFDGLGVILASRAAYECKTGQ